MRNKTSAKSSLFLIELVLVIFFFTVSSAVCLSIFSKAVEVSTLSKNISLGTSAVSSAAACYKNYDGNLDEICKSFGYYEIEDQKAYIYFDSDWKTSSEKSDYFVVIELTGENTAKIYASDLDGEIFASIDTALLGGNT